jgi:type III secretion system YscD/HrpQ family protein
MSKPLILKVLSGSQFGVEIGLADGEYSFGSGSEADIQFADLSMAPVHGQLRLASGKVEIRATGAALQTASGLVIAAGDGEWREIAQLDRVTAGTSIFAVGGSDANWSSLATTPAPLPDRRSEPVRRARSGGTWLIGAVVVALCVGAVLLLTSGGQQLPIAARLTPDENVQQVRNTLAALPFENQLDVTVEADGTITVAGYVETATERRAVQNALADLGIDVRRRIWALEALRSDIAGLISSQEVEMTADLQPDGELILSGVSLDPAAVERTVGLLESGVFGLSKITDNVQTADDFLQQVNDLTLKLQLNELVFARLDGLLIEMNGVVPRDKTDNWVGFMRGYARQIAPYIPLRSFVTLEGEPAGGTVPVLMGGPEAEVDGARVLQPETLETETADPSNLFAQPDSAAPTPAAEPVVEDSAAPAAEAELTPEETARAAELSAYEAMINEFAQQNPELVSMLIRALTNGQVSDIEGLRAFFAAPPGGEEPLPPTADLPGGAMISDPDALVRLINETETPGSGSLPATVTETTESPTAPPMLSETSVDDGVAGAAPSPAVAGVADFDVMGAVGRLNSAMEKLFGDSGGEPALTEEAEAANPELADVSQEMIAMARAQADALERGETLLKVPAPLEAERASEILVDRCWDGGSITLDSLPAVLLWMDILSISTNLDITEIRSDNRLLFMEAALNPDQIRECLARSDSEFATALLQNSEFLRETSRNELFAVFLFRNVPRYPLDIAGVSLEGSRYAQLTDGRKLSVGSAPNIDSRVAVIGDLGLLIRVTDGYRVNLYASDMGWFVSGG